ncbi:hypothetical protein HUW51_21050 [Adhaeribacter swui]|uniref:DUF4595 domain-containing protein n=1 Tax=Adhaeribacter swui TaxID=2086471 RepID=A0A7G7GD50_9BACT|nr:hypothetical protein [Adhaeribacter swui]QNF35084.1 hypothetical protein HUW51_21050 [Adhaeribacter swui]
MKKPQLTIALLGFTFMSIFASCEDSKKNDPQPNPGDNHNNQGKSCQIATISENTATGLENSEFIYDAQGKLTRVNTKENNAVTEYMTFEYNNAGKATKMSMFNANNVLQEYFTVELNANGNPTKMNFYSKEEDSNKMENITRYEYEYNGQNKTSKVNMFLDLADKGTLSLAGYMTFTYDNKGNPNHKEYAVAMGVGQAPTLAYTYDYTYDSKENPVKSTPIINVEPLAVNNVTKVVATNKLTNAVDKIQSQDITYEYNNNGLPTKITTKTQAGTTTSQTYSYNCK